MRSEREQLIKSSSTHKAESQFCSPSTVISFYLRVMSYGIFALGNTMSSINVFHLLHKQGQVIPASFYLHNQSNWLCCREREQGEQKRQNIRKKSHYFNPLRARVRRCVSLCDDGAAAWITDITFWVPLTEAVELANFTNIPHQISRALLWGTVRDRDSGPTLFEANEESFVIIHPLCCSKTDFPIWFESFRVAVCRSRLSARWGWNVGVLISREI